MQEFSLGIEESRLKYKTIKKWEQLIVFTIWKLIRELLVCYFD